MLFDRRKRLEDIAKREAAGENVWTDSFDAAVRRKIVLAFRDISGQAFRILASNARGLILRDEGLFFLASPNLDPDEDLMRHLLNCRDEQVPTVIEAMHASISAADHSLRPWVQWGSEHLFARDLSTVLREHRVSFDLVEGHMIEFRSREMHVNVVVPALQLLAGRAGLAKVEQAYRGALDEIARSDAPDAITDAGTALQELLIALGCSGDQLGPLIRSARSKGLFAAHDQTLTDALERVLHWASADRSQSGDSHKVKSTSIDDAWLIVHVVGALILRLSSPGRERGRS